MTEEDNNDKYIICSKCISKHINDEDHINKYLGYTILEMRYKTCVRCRAINNNNCKTYSEHILKITKEYYDKEERKYHNKQYREKNADRLKEHD